MARIRSLGGEMIMGVVACLLALVIFDTAAKLASFAPALENMISPVVSIIPTYDQRDDDKACFFLDIKKLANAKPLTYDFYGETRIAKNARWGPPLPLSAYLVENDSTQRVQNSALETHPIGATWRRHYCFEMPGTVATWQTIRVTGEAEHRRHPGWTSVTPIPDFYVPSLKGDAKL